MTTKAKPFIKWVGGKGQLIEQLEAKLPADFDNWDNVTYIEPFVGGGAMLYYMLQQHPNIKRAVINDINSDLITCYKTVRDNVEQLISALHEIQEQYYTLQDMEAKREMFIAVRERYNEKNLDPIENTAKFFFSTALASMVCIVLTRMDYSMFHLENICNLKFAMKELLELTVTY